MIEGVAVRVVDIRYYSVDKNNYIGYGYKVDPNPDDKYEWFMEGLLYKYTAKPARVIALPCAASEPVQQPRRRGRLPKGIASFWDARYKRRCRDEELNKLREKLRSLNRYDRWWY